MSAVTNGATMTLFPEAEGASAGVEIAGLVFVSHMAPIVFPARPAVQDVHPCFRWN
jgi:hypothetical protein